MARILLSAAPFTGHVAPMCSVAHALSARGHDVRVYTGPAFADQVAATGARLLPWRKAPDFDENDLQSTFPRLIGKKRLSQVFINITDVFIGTAPEQVDDLQAEWDREPWDAMAGDDVSVGAVLFAERSGVPWATVSVLPLNMAAPSGPPSGLGLAPGRTAIVRTRDSVLRAAVPLLSLPLRRPLARARERVGLAPSRRTFDRVVFSPRLVVASGAPLLDFARTDRPAHVHFVGRLTALSQGEVPAWWGDLDARRVVHVSQGTQNIDPADLIRPAVEALADRDVLVVVSTGIRDRVELPFPVPPNVRVAGVLPYSALLPRLEAMITNGGWGGTLAALSHGVPLVIAGGDLDKPEIAARVAWSGSGVNLRTGTPSAAKVADGYDRVMDDPAFQDAAGRVAQQLNSLGGAPRAAELLETLFAS
ncbi:glycosyltransferase [Microbacterium sp. NPDC055910]|uniref:glycosyltransferase n=1 Tax=Microbacterium sp. NPDC055910 TaxID=3345659 RepID=UPI0035E3A248